MLPLPELIITKLSDESGNYLFPNWHISGLDSFNTFVKCSMPSGCTCMYGVTNYVYMRVYINERNFKI